jgi:hypothetical protein
MSEADELMRRLRPIGDKLVGFHNAAGQLHEELNAISDERPITIERLVEIEEICDRIYAEIADFNELYALIDKVSPGAAAEIVEVRDALQLVLMEVTELGTSLYAKFNGPMASLEVESGEA